MKAFFERFLPGRLKSGLHTEDGNLLNEMSNGLALRPSTFVLGESPAREAAFVCTVHASRVNRGQGGLSLLRESLADQLIEHLEPSKKDAVIRVNLASQDSPFYGALVAQCFENYHLVFTFPDSAEQFDQSRRVILENISSVFTHWSTQVDALIVKGGNVKLTPDRPFYMDQSSRYMDDLEQSGDRAVRRFLIALAQSHSLGWRGFWSLAKPWQAEISAGWFANSAYAPFFFLDDDVDSLTRHQAFALDTESTKSPYPIEANTVSPKVLARLSDNDILVLQVGDSSLKNTRYCRVGTFAKLNME